jgi:hypothetical protein
MEIILYRLKDKNVYIPLIAATISYKPQPKTKLKVLHEYLDNMFLPSTDKEEILQIFQRSQRIYYGFSKLAQLYKFQNAKATISTDLYLNEISRDHRNAICIHTNSTNYWFMLGDLCRHITAALTNSPYYYADPIPIKNPYTNIPFTDAELYTIYFKVRAGTFLFPILFHKFFLSEFDIARYRMDNESDIRESIIHRHMHTSEESKLYHEIMIMLFNHRKLSQKIHESIPRPEFVKIMRPYLYLYIISKYHINIEKAATSKGVLYDKLYDLFIFNPQFGRMYLTRKHKVYFNLEHPKFGMNDAIQSLL